MLDTEVLIKYGQVAQGRDGSEATVILNHKRASAQLIDQVETTEIPSSLLLTMHGNLMRGLLAPESLSRVRGTDVRIPHSAYRPSSNTSELKRGLDMATWKAEHIRDPFESMLFLMTSISYLQAFEDGNKRLGRLCANIPLLRAGLPPLSFVGMDKKKYIQGLIEFYELGEVGLLADEVSKNYVETAPTYLAASSSQRVPRSIEIREATRIDKAVRKSVEAPKEPPQDHEEICAQISFDLSEEDQKVFFEVVSKILDGLTPDNARVWGVDPKDVEDFQRRRAKKHTQPKMR